MTSELEQRMAFTDAETAYLGSQQLGRLATIQPDGSPQVKPVGFRVNPGLGTIDVTGFNLTSSQKFRNVRRNGQAALVVDDIASPDPWAGGLPVGRGRGGEREGGAPSWGSGAPGTPWRPAPRAVRCPGSAPAGFSASASRSRRASRTKPAC